MLRRYNSTNLDTIVLRNKRTTIGSASTCDIVVQGRGVVGVHAAIESTTNGYLLRDISITGETRMNGDIVVGQISIKSGDSIQVGKAIPFVFESDWMYGSRPTSANVKQKSPSPQDNRPFLPLVVGRKITPTASPNGSRSSGMTKRRTNARSSASSTESSQDYDGVHSTTGFTLLQKVIRLQKECAKKDEEIHNLTWKHSSSVPAIDYTYNNPSPPSLPLSSSSLHRTLPPIPSSYHPSHSNPILYSHPNSIITPSRPTRITESKNFELYAYRGFVGAIANILRQFNDRVLRHPQREYAEVFNSIYRAVDVPLNIRITEIEKYCEAVLIDNDFEEGDELTTKLEKFLRESRREKILELMSELEMLMPIIKEAASNARENIKLCTVFTQWSRQFGDIIRTSNFTSQTLLSAIDDLKREFSDAQMSRHWLPPSITPILRLAALELEKRENEYNVNMNDMVSYNMERKKSIDETLDNCITHVETIEHEMAFHINRLENKAKDYGSFQTLDIDTVTRITKVIDSIQSNINQLSSFNQQSAPRPNSVLFFEITREDIGKKVRSMRSDSESESSSSSLRKISNQMVKKHDKIEEEEEDKDKTRMMEMEMRKVLMRMSELNGNNVIIGEGVRTKVAVDSVLLENVLKCASELLDKYQEGNDNGRKKRSVEENEHPIIIVQDEEGEEKKNDERGGNEEEVDVEVNVPFEDMDDTTEEMETSDEILPSDEEYEKVDEKEEEEGTGEGADEKEEEDTLDENSKEEETSGMVDDTVDGQITEEKEKEEVGEEDTVGKKSTDNEGNHEETPAETFDNIEEEEVKKVELVHEERMDGTSGEGLNSVKEIEHEEDEEEEDDKFSPIPSEIHENDEETGTEENEDGSEADQEMSEEEEEDKEEEGEEKEEEDGGDRVGEGVEGKEDGVKEGGSMEESRNEAEMRRGMFSTSDDDNVTVIEVLQDGTRMCNKPRQDTIEEIKRQEDVPFQDIEYVNGVDDTSEKEEGNGIEENEEEKEWKEDIPMTSHLKSHINTSNGRPNITYQYPIRRNFYSPPMKRRSKSEEKRVKSTLSKRPPFVLY